MPLIDALTALVEDQFNWDTCVPPPSPPAGIEEVIVQLGAGALCTEQVEYPYDPESTPLEHVRDCGTHWLPYTTLDD